MPVRPVRTLAFGRRGRCSRRVTQRKVSSGVYDPFLPSHFHSSPSCDHLSLTQTSNEPVCSGADGSLTSSPPSPYILHVIQGQHRAGPGEQMPKVLYISMSGSRSGHASAILLFPPEDLIKDRNRF